MGGYSGLPNGFVPGGTASLQDLITGFAQPKANIAATEASTALTNAQVPVQQGLAQEEDLKNRQLQQQLRDQDILRKGYVSAAALPPDQVSGAVRDYSIRNGISAPGLQAFQLHDLDLRSKTATLKKEDRENLDATHQQAGELLNGIAGIQDPAARAAAYTQALPVLQDKAPDVRWKSPDQLQADDIPFYQSALNHAVAILGQKDTAQKIATSAAQQGSAEAEAANRQAEFEGIRADAIRKQKTLAGTNEQGLSAKDQADILREGATTAETARHNKQQEFATGREIALKQKQFDATFGSGLDANGRPLSPEEQKAAALQDPTAQAIANYQIPAPPTQTRGGVVSPVLRKVLAINPNYDGAQFAARNKVQQDFSAAGNSGKLITSADTALAHLATASKAGQALNNSDIPALNSLANAVGAQLGQTPQKTYDTIISMVAPEISKAVIGAAGGESERQQMQKNFGSNASPAQREQAIGAAVGLLSQRVHKQAQAYESSIGRPLDLSKRLSPESQAVIQKYGGVGNGPKPPAVGAVEDGHRFTGGNPADPKSWEAVK